MRLSFQNVVSVLLCVAFGFCLAYIASSPSAIAQIDAPNTAPRFQVSAYAGTVNQSVSHGAYVIDTVTGKVWQVRAGGKAEVVAEKLP